MCKLNQSKISNTDVSIFNDEIKNLDWEIVRTFIGQQFFNNKNFDIDRFVMENEQFLKYFLQNIQQIKQNLIN